MSDDQENVCPHCGEAKPTPHILVLADDPYCEECWVALLEETARDYYGVSDERTH